MDRAGMNRCRPRRTCRPSAGQTADHGQGPIVDRASINGRGTRRPSGRPGGPGGLSNCGCHGNVTALAEARTGLHVVFGADRARPALLRAHVRFGGHGRGDRPPRYQARAGRLGGVSRAGRPAAPSSRRTESTWESIDSMPRCPRRCHGPARRALRRVGTSPPGTLRQAETRLHGQRRRRGQETVTPDGESARGTMRAGLPAGMGLPAANAWAWLS